MPWISLVLTLPPSRTTIPHSCAMLLTRRGTIVVWCKWDARSPTLPLNSFHLQSNACGIDYRNGLQPFAAKLPCHLHCTVLLYVAMPLQFYCHTQTSSTFLSVIHLSNSSMTAALMPLVLYTSANLKSRVYLTHLPTGIFCFRFLLPFTFILIGTSFISTPI